MQVTIRIEKYHYQTSQKAYRFNVNGRIVWLPIGSVKITENGKFQDIDMPKWMASQKGLDDYIVAEFPE